MSENEIKIDFKKINLISTALRDYSVVSDLIGTIYEVTQKRHKTNENIDGELICEIEELFEKYKGIS